MTKLLITGGAGFIGTSIARSMLKLGVEVRIVDNFSNQVHNSSILPSDLVDHVDLIKADVRNRDAMCKALNGVDCLLHLAAETGTGQSMYEIQRYFSVNVQGTATLLDILQNEIHGKSVRSVVVASSRAIYGEGAYRCNNHGLVFPNQRSWDMLSRGKFEPLCPICNSELILSATSEQSPFQPLSIYGLTKQVQEQAVLLCARSLGISGFGLRYQNVYGPGQSLKNPYTGILAIFANLARQGQTLEIYEDGLESRDFVYIDDVVEATTRCIFHQDRFVGAINVGSGVATNIISLAEEVNSYFSNISPVYISGKFRVGDIRHNVADLVMLERVLGFKPGVTFKQGIVKFLDWAIEQKPHDKEAYSRSVEELAIRGLMGRSVNMR